MPKAAAITRRTASWSAGCSGRTSKLTRGPRGVVRRRGRAGEPEGIVVYSFRHAATPLYGAAMEISSLGNRTDLAMLERSGSEITDRGTHLVVRTPDNPTFWWGNFLLLAEAPADEERAADWLREFEGEFPQARHRAIAVDGTDGSLADLGPFTALG